MNYKIVVDTNVILYFLFDKLCPDENKLEKIQNLFSKALENKVKLLITTRILDEIIFKSLILITGRNFKQLKKSKDIIKENGFIVPKIFEFIKNLNIEIIEVKEQHYRKMEEIIKNYGLFGNDAVTLTIMKSRNLKYLATFDDDFSNTFVKNYFYHT